MSPKRKWAITGGTGFIGQHLAKRISQLLPDVKLTLFDRKKHSLLEPESLRSFVVNQEAIFHLAALIRETREVLETNTLGTLGLLEAIKQFGEKGVKLIFPSSFAVYQVHFKPELIKESFPIEPRNLYGFSKLFAERLISYYAQAGLIKGAILRFSSIYGPGCPPFRQSLVSTMAHQVKNGEIIEVLGDGSQEKDLVYVEDAVEAFLKAVNFQPRAVEIFNICAGKGVSVNELISFLEKLGNKKAKVKYLEEKTNEASQYWIGDYQKVKKKLGWQPKTPIERGLADLFA